MKTEKWTVIDAHHHYCPGEAARQIGTVGEMNYAARMKERGGIYKQAQILERNLQFMEESGIDMAVLNQAAWSACGLNICKIMNDSYAGIMKRYPGKFIACAHIPLEASRQAMEELERAITHLGLQGVSLMSSTNELSLGSRELFPLYEKVIRLDIPVVIHPTIRTPLYGGSGAIMGSGISREYDVAKSTLEVMLNVLNKFPEIRFLMPHYGGCMPLLKYRIMAFYETDGIDVPAEIKGAAKPPSQLKKLGLVKAFNRVFNQLYFDAAGYGGWVPTLKSAVMAIRADRLCFGSDYPFDLREAKDVKATIADIKKLDISQEAKRNILGGNVKRIFKI